MNDNRPTHLDLFSGIGGFALAAEWAGFRTVAFCDNNQVRRRNLKKFWPAVKCFKDVSKLGAAQLPEIDLLTGGFPCQPFSKAGKRRGKEDDRYLWPEMFRIISEAKPRWVVGENVTGIEGLGLETCFSDLESIGYETAPALEIPACGVGAQHIRARFWIVAHYNGPRELQPQRGIKNERRRISDPHSDVSNGYSIGRNEATLQRRAAPKGSKKKSEPGPRFISKLTEPFPPTGEPLEALLTPDTCGTPYGLPGGMDRLEGLGNAIVPQVAYQILKEIYNLI